MLKKCILIIILLFLFSVNAVSESDYQTAYNLSGAENIEKSLPEQAKEIMDGLNIDISDEKTMENLSAEGIFSSFVSLIESHGKKPLKMLAFCFSGMLIFAAINALDGDKYKTVLRICSVGVFAEIITELFSLISSAAGYLKSVNTFTTAFVPVLSAVSALSGKTLSSLKVLTPVLTASALINFAGNFVVIPVMSAATALCFITSICKNINTEFLSGLKKAAIGILSFFSVIFTGVVSCIGKLSSAADTVTLKTAKFFVSGVPYVGTVLGELSSKIFASLNLLKSGVGVYGIIAYFALMLPVLSQTVIWHIGLSVLKSLCSFLSLDSVLPVLSGFCDMLSLLNAIILLSGGVFIISSAVVISL